MSEPMAQDDLVRLRVAANALQAHLWRHALEAAGIRCFVVGEHLGELFGGGSRSFIEIWVHRAEQARAAAVLAAATEGETEEI